MKRPTTRQFFKSSVSYALLLISLSPLFPQSPTRDDVESWWRRGSKYMRGQGEEFKDRTPAERRKLAEPWLLSAWQNRKQLTPFTKKQVGVRLLQARIANTNYLEAQETLAEIEADPDFGPCKLDPKDLPLDRIYTCAEYRRLAAALQYDWYSQANQRFEDARGNHCTTLFHALPHRPSCLDLALKYAAASRQGFTELLARLGSTNDPKSLDSVCQILVGAAACGKEVLTREAQTRLNLLQLAEGLALQESGRYPEALKKFVGVDPKGQTVKDLPAAAALHAARIERDLNHPEAAAKWLEPFRTDGASAAVRWRIELVCAGLQIKAGDLSGALETLERAFPFRERILAEAVTDKGVLDLDSSLSESSNSDDVFLSAILAADGPRLANRRTELLSQYAAAIFGSGDYATRRLFEELRTHHESLLRGLSQTLNSEAKDWAFGSLISERRRSAYDELEKQLSTKVVFQLQLQKAASIWQQLWSHPSTRSAELVVILLYRPFRFDKPTAEAMCPPEYLMLHFLDRKTLRVVNLGQADLVDRDVEALRKSLENGHGGDPRLWNTFRKKFDFASPATSGAPGRLLIMASGQFQQFPWALVPDRGGRELIESRSFVQMNSAREVASWAAASLSTSQASFTVPDLSPLQTVFGQSALGQLAARPWSVEETQAVRASVQAFQSLARAPTDSLSGAAASEEALASRASPANLYLFTHGAYLSNARGMSPWDRGVLLLTPERMREGVVLASEVKTFRLQGTRLAVLAVCKSGGGSVRRNEPLEGLRSAFHVAGARTVVAPIWNVDIIPAANLFTAFFEQKRDLDLALREAQLSLRKNKTVARAWAGWMLSGDPSSPR